MSVIAPFHDQADEIGQFIWEDRALDVERYRRPEPEIGPSENYD